MAQRLTRHNGRANKNGVYKADHNDRRFDLENADHILGQHERNAKARHPERDRSAEDILADKRFCPEETIYQIGTIEDHADPGTLFSVANEFLDELDRRLGDHVHVLNWAL